MGWLGERTSQGCFQLAQRVHRADSHGGSEDEQEDTSGDRAGPGWTTSYVVQAAEWLQLPSDDLQSPALLGRSPRPP